MHVDPDPLIEESTYLIGIDDTDTIDSEYGTGKVSRLLGDHLTTAVPSVEWRGSVRQQLLVDPRVPYTTHNSSATLICATPEEISRDDLVDVCSTFLTDIAADGSDPGLCVGRRSSVSRAVREFGLAAAEELVDEQQAYELADASELFLDEYGGTGEGVIGALAGVGRTASLNHGRFIEYGHIREFDGAVPVAELRDDGIVVELTDGEELQAGTVETEGWVRPLLRRGRPVLEVEPDSDGTYRATNLDE